MSGPAENAPAKRQTELMGLGVILVLALLLRLRQLGSLMPWFDFEDETRMVRACLHMINNRTLDPGITLYPALSFYINTLFYLAWALAGNLSILLKSGPGAALDLFRGLTETDPQLIMLSRFVSLLFGMGSLVFSWLFARLYLQWRWALFATLLVAINTIHVAMSILAKNDTIYLFFFAGSFYTSVMYFRRGGIKWIVPAAIFSSCGFLCKNNFQPFIMLAIIVMVRGLSAGKGLFSLIRSREVQAGVLASITSAFIASPYTFIHLDKTIGTVGWLYYMAEVLSTWHTDPHHWWLDRYFYLFSVVLPFVFGIVLFGAVVAGTVHQARKRAITDPFILYSLVWYIYIFASGSGGPRGGSFAYYFFIITVPLGVIAAAEWLQDLSLSGKKMIQAAGLGFAVVILAASLFRVDAYRSVFISAYDEAGPWLFKRLKPQDRVLMISVYKPKPVFGAQKFKAVWPQQFTPEAIAAFNPDVIIIDSWLVAGFRKVYREAPVAPLVDAYISGKDGFRPEKRFRPQYLGRSYFAAIDPEQDTELLVLRKHAGEKGHD
jgi:hypothetical protein